MAYRSNCRFFFCNNKTNNVFLRRNFKNANIMNKKRRTTGICRLTKMALTICIMLMGRTAWAKTYTWTIGTNDLGYTEKPATSVTKGSPSLSWSVDWNWNIVSKTTYKYIGYPTNNGIQIGKNADNFGKNTINFKTSSIATTIRKITIEGYGYQNSSSQNAVKLTVKVGGTSYKCNSMETGEFTTTNAAHDFTGSSKGEIEISIENTLGNKGMYIRSISIEYDDLELSESDATLPSTNTSYDKVTLTRNMASGKWSTLCLPFALTSEEIVENFGDGTLVKTLSGVTVNDGEFNMSFEDATTIAAGTPYLVKATKDVTTITAANTSGGVAVNTTLSETATTVSDGGGNSITFKGHFGTQTVAAGNYIIKDNKFYVVGNSGTTNKGYRGYFTIAGPNANKVKALNLDEDVTGIEIVQELEQEDNTMYDLQGRVIKNPQLGHLYIMQGKKYLNKK